MARPPAKRTRRAPQRTCIACRTTGDKRALVRIVRTPEGRVRPDPTGKADGRGAYLCSNPECWQRATAKGLLATALKVTITNEDLRAISEFGESLLNGEAS